MYKKRDIQRPFSSILHRNFEPKMNAFCSRRKLINILEFLWHVDKSQWSVKIVLEKYRFNAQVFNIDCIYIITAGKNLFEDNYQMLIERNDNFNLNFNNCKHVFENDNIITQNMPDMPFLCAKTAYFKVWSSKVLNNSIMLELFFF